MIKLCIIIVIFVVLVLLNFFFPNSDALNYINFIGAVIIALLIASKFKPVHYSSFNEDEQHRRDVFKY